MKIAHFTFQTSAYKLLTTRSACIQHHDAEQVSKSNAHRSPTTDA
ncbi:hypothetical protein SynA1825c_02117 [Synechococcus sp. A18-25c]|nr:hypothetical protein SynA1825c_02117 [Synechococcus sp. A18-25c]